MSTLSSEELLESLRWRYATKKFLAGAMIPPQTWQALEESLLLTPSSYGLQPWKFLVVTDPEIKAQLVPCSWNQQQVGDCSHLVVFAALKKMTAAYIQEFLASTADIRDVPVENLEGFGKMMERDLVHGPRSQQIEQWSANQLYIALGNFMTCAALLEVDTCPMEGIQPAEYDRILGLEGSDFTTKVACPAGYRDPSDKYASMPKVRYPASRLIQRI